MHVINPKEDFPEIGTVQNPAVFYDGRDASVCYEPSVRSEGGNVVLKFRGVIDFRITPVNIDGLRDCRYPVNPWAFNEVIGGAETARWHILKARLWIVTFNDLTIEVLFRTVEIIRRDAEEGPQDRALVNTLNGLQGTGIIAL
ncbi:hypothetical protein [Rhizobium sp. NXC24]|uniref:hypothetical protein n=1 Tax=Rhizobium sp. NXC24 TaxID=2048897 RepID=UPI000CF2CF36|nr:hypothetical protein [Rhizobium sp. NXC24]